VPLAFHARWFCNENISSTLNFLSLLILSFNFIF
jgi:hypothetical protein